MAKRSGPIQLVQPQIHQLDPQPEKSQRKKSRISYDSILNDALEGVALAVERLTDIVSDDASENKDKIAAAKGLLDIVMRVAEVKVVEELPLLKQLEEKCRQA